MADNGPDRTQPVTIGGREFPAPVSFDDVPPTDFRRLVKIPWFDHAGVLADAANDYQLLEPYACDGEFFWRVGVEALRSRVWQNVIAVDDVDLSSFGSFDTRPEKYLAAVAKGMLTFGVGQPIDEGLDVDFWRYRVYSERPYVSKLCSLTDADLEQWRGQYHVDVNAICWNWQL